MQEFTVTDEQERQIEEWKRSLPHMPDNYTGAVGGNYTYEFTPTGIGTLAVIRRCDGHELNFTDYDEF